MLHPVLQPLFWPLTNPMLGATLASRGERTFDYLVDESGNFLTDESANLLTE